MSSLKVPTKPYYFDHASTTPVSPVVAKAMAENLSHGPFANSSAQHICAIDSQVAIETARTQVAKLIHADARDIIWTSGATESNNLAIQGLCCEGDHIITVVTEHHSVLAPCRTLEKHGTVVDYLTVDKQGRISLDALSSALRPNTKLVSIMHVNNETGVMHDLAKIGALLQEHPAYFHVDAAQSAGKLPIDVRAMHIDLLTLSAHKIYGPQGVGSLFANASVRSLLKPLMLGGGQENGLRSGTLAVHQILGMGIAFEQAAMQQDKDLAHLQILQQTFVQGLSTLPGAQLNMVLSDEHFPGILSVRFDTKDNEMLLASMPNVCLSPSSACQSSGHRHSHVLKAIGLTAQQIDHTIRFSFGRLTSETDLQYVLNRLGNLL